MYGKKLRDVDRQHVQQPVNIIYYSLLIECPIEGQVYTECGTACPPVCNKAPQLFCTLQCVPGCQCPSGTVLDELQHKCVKAEECGKIIFYSTTIPSDWCPFSAACPPTCTHEFCSKRRNRRKPCSRYINTSVAMAQYIITNSFHFSPTSHSKSGCPNQCRSTYCNACYYSEDTRSTPQKCNKGICTDKADCLQQWAKCVDRKNRKKNKVDKQLI